MAPADDGLLEVDALRSAFGGPFDLRLARGECVCILGPSGAGKSVLLRLIADLDPGSGDVELDGQGRGHWSGPEWRRRVVYQSAEPAWWGPDAASHFEADVAPRVSEMLPKLGLATVLLDTEIARLSTGERQRLALVRSLAVEPRVLLLDEPSAALDADSTLAMEALLHERLAAGLAILLVTHSREQARRMSHRAFVMANGILAPA
jgi:ABC-type iron transport system FetAB ATPase subunit